MTLSVEPQVTARARGIPRAVGSGDEGQVRLLTSSWITSMCGDIVDFGDVLVVGSGAALRSTASRERGRSRYPPRIRQKSQSKRSVVARLPRGNCLPPRDGSR